jgi:hypothetical protein
MTPLTHHRQLHPPQHLKDHRRGSPSRSLRKAGVAELADALDSKADATLGSDAAVSISSPFSQTFLITRQDCRWMRG